MEAVEGVRFVPLGEIARAHGVRGELRVRVFNPESDALLGSRKVWLESPAGRRKVVRVQAARRVEGAVLLKVEGVDDRDAAQALQKTLVGLPREELEPTEEGEFYLCDVVGAALVGPDGSLGVVEEVVSYPTSDVLVVRLTTDKPARVEIPLVDAFVERVDVEGRCVVVRPEALELLD